MNMSKDDVAKIIEQSSIPFLLRTMVISFIKAMPEEQFKAMFNNVFDTAQSVMSNSPEAEAKLAALGVPSNVAQSLIKEARQRALN